MIQLSDELRTSETKGEPVDLSKALNFSQRFRESTHEIRRLLVVQVELHTNKLLSFHEILILQSDAQTLLGESIDIPLSDKQLFLALFQKALEVPNLPR